MGEQHLLEAIGEALGLEGPYVEQVGEREEAIHLGSGTSPLASASLEVLGGAVHPSGKVAWIEQRSKPPRDGFVDVAIDVRLAEEGEVRSLCVDTYNPYFGCSIYWARWYGEHFCFAYHEKHKLILSVVGPSWEEQRLLLVAAPILMLEERVVFVNSYYGVLQGWWLPSLAPMLPVVLPRIARYPIQYLVPHGEGVCLETWAEKEDIEGHDTMDWIALRKAREAQAFLHPVRLPPRSAWPDRESLISRWQERYPQASTGVKTLGGPWIEPQRPVTSYGGLYRGLGGFGLVEDSLKKIDLKGVPEDAPLLIGWDGPDDLDQRYDAIFAGLLSRVARSLRSK